MDNNNYRMPNEPDYLKEKDLMKNGPVLKITGIGLVIVLIVFIFCEKGITENIIKMGFFCFIFWIFLAMLLYLRKLIYTTDAVSNNSIKVEGTIIAFRMRYGSLSTDGPRNIEMFNLTISYIDPKTNQKKEFETPFINFNPVTDLGSKKCSVLIDGNKVYATDFIVGKNIGKCLWDNNDKSMIKYINKKMNFVYAEFFGTIFFILFILFILSFFI